MKITKMSVTSLFGMLDHEIPIRTEDRITIIHGPNGSGKTALLRMVDGLFHNEFAEFRKIPFEKFRVDFDDDSCVVVIKMKDEVGKQTNLKVVLYQDECEIGSFSPDLLKSVPVHFIESRRLLASHGKRGGREEFNTTSPELVIEVYAKQLSKTIQSKLGESTVLSLSLDRTFPVRLVEQSKRAFNLTNDELRNRLSALEDKRERLIEAGLLDEDKSDIDFSGFQMIDLEESTKSILSLYIEDVEKKLGFFDEILSKIELLKEIVNKRFLYKQMSISREHGFMFTAANHQPLSPTDLSSGEQHELVLLYDLLFNMKPNSFILIDEPELSLHIAWQKQFLKDLQEIIKLTDSNFLIATHSPQIIHDRWDLTVEFKETS